MCEYLSRLWHVYVAGARGRTKIAKIKTTLRISLTDCRAETNLQRTASTSFRARRRRRRRFALYRLSPYLLRVLSFVKVVTSSSTSSENRLSCKLIYRISLWFTFTKTHSRWSARVHCYSSREYLSTFRTLFRRAVIANSYITQQITAEYTRRTALYFCKMGINQN